MSELFANYKEIILTLHILGAVVWIGGMIAMRFAAHFSFAKLEPHIRLERSSEALRNLFIIVAPFVAILLITALIMAAAMGLHHGELSGIAFAKEGIWSAMTLNLIIMAIRRHKAQKLLDEGEYSKAKPILTIIANYQVPANILLGIVAIYLGVNLE